MHKESLALFLGMLCGDGNLCIKNKKRKYGLYHDYCTQFCNTNKEIMGLFSKLFFELFGLKVNIYSRKRDGRKEIFDFTSYSREVFNKIKEMGFPVGVKRDKLRIPEIIKRGSEIEKIYFLWGVFLTDGSLKKGGIFFHTGSKVFLEEISDLIYSLFGTRKNVKSYKQREIFISYQLSLNKEESRKMLSMPPSHNGIASVLSLKNSNF